MWQGAPIGAERKPGRTGGRELRRTQNLDLDWMVLRDSLGHRATKCPGNSGFLGDVNTTGLRDRLEDRISSGLTEPLISDS
jgi:hypothetical protein